MTIIDEAEHTQEVRLAVVVYGGVSLAIYINGVAQEMLRLVRATAPTLSDRSKLLVTEPKGSEKIYRELGKLLGDPERTPVEAGGSPGNKVHTRFVIDVLAGTSAGGINAVFLAKALANNQKLRSLERTWIKEGDIEALLNDRGTDRLPKKRGLPPVALLNGARMYEKLLDALDAMDDDRDVERADGSTESGSPLVEVLDLYCTATDLSGLALDLPLSEREGQAREFKHKAVFRFQHTPKLAPFANLPPGPFTNDFVADNNPFLAFAARCTSSFPFAFEPFTLKDIGPTLQTSDRHRADCVEDAIKQWEHLYPEGYPKPDFERRVFADGGYLDNKPFTYAVRTILERDADLPVIRKLVYVEPKPEPLKPGSEDKPDAIANLLMAGSTLPRAEPIREDLELVLQRNQEVLRLRRVLDAVQMDSALRGEPGNNPTKWLKGSGTRNSFYEAYERLKLSTVTDDLLVPLARHFGINLQEREGVGLRAIAGAWRDIAYPHAEAQRQFLMDFDIRYRLRRLRDIGWEITRLHGQPPAVLVLAPVEVERYRVTLRTLKQSLRGAHAHLLSIEREITKADQERLAPELRTELDWVSDLDARPPRRFEEQAALDLPERAKLVGAQGAWFAKLKELSDLVRTRYRESFEKVSEHVLELLGETPSLHPPSALEPGAVEAQRRVRERYMNFEAWDARKLPLVLGMGLGEGQPVDIHRISPEDTGTGAVDLLKGTALGNFGAFLDETWRENDILRGRLDGAERLITLLLHHTASHGTHQHDLLKKDLIKRAHAEIVTEFLDSIDFERDQGWKERLERFQTRHVRAKPEPHLVAASAARGTTITGKILEDISSERGLPTKPYGFLVTLGKFAWSIVELSMPRSAGEIFSRYWLALLGLLGVVSLALGLVLSPYNVDVRTITIFGACLLLSSAVVHYLRGYLTTWLGGTGDPTALFQPAMMVGGVIALPAVLLRGEVSGAAVFEWSFGPLTLGFASMASYLPWLWVSSGIVTAVLGVLLLFNRVRLLFKHGFFKWTLDGQLRFGLKQWNPRSPLEHLSKRERRELASAFTTETFLAFAATVLLVVSGLRLPRELHQPAVPLAGATLIALGVGIFGFRIAQARALSKVLAQSDRALDTDQRPPEATHAVAYGFAQWLCAAIAVAAYYLYVVRIVSP